LVLGQLRLHGCLPLGLVVYFRKLLQIDFKIALGNQVLSQLRDVVNLLQDFTLEPTLLSLGKPLLVWTQVELLVTVF
jgi:predicted Zn-dependent protease